MSKNAEAKETKLQKVYGYWDKLPNPVKIILYVSVSGLLAQLSLDLAKLQGQNPYYDILILLGYNLILWVGQEIIKRKTSLES